MSILHCRSITTTSIPNTTTGHSLIQNPQQPRNIEAAKPSLLELGGILSVVASLYLTELYHVSNFEGGRGMLIFFALAPLGLIVGFIVGWSSLCAVVVPDSAGSPRHRGLHSGLRLDSLQLFLVFSILRPIIRPNLMANRFRSNSRLKFRQR